MKKLIFTFITMALGLVLMTVAFFALRSQNLTTVRFDAVLDGVNIERGENSLVKYTEGHSVNDYGYELLVEARTGFVVGGGETVDIVDGCYVLSGHGDKADLLKEVKIGDIVKTDGNKISFKYNLRSSNLKAASLYEDEVSTRARARLEGFYDLDRSALKAADRNIKKARWQFKKCFFGLEADEKSSLKAYSELMHAIDQKFYLTSEYFAVDGRAIWHRPNSTRFDEKTVEGVKAFCSALKTVGINTLYVETFWDGMTTYYSPLLSCQHPQMKDCFYGEDKKDYVATLIEECHRLGIEVHAWVELLSVADLDGKVPSYIDESLIAADSSGSKSKGFLDPSNPEVIDFLGDVVQEMVTLYPFDGVSYDYIRYPGIDFGGDYFEYGFTDNSVKRFAAENNYTGTNLDADMAADKTLRDKWHAFQQGCITDVVSTLTSVIRAHDKDLLVSASPYGYLWGAKVVYMQDVESWIQKGYLDVVLPMIYTEDEENLVTHAQMFEEYSQKVFQYTGISPIYKGASLKTNQSLTMALKDSNISGVALFASQNYFPGWGGSRAQRISSAMSANLKGHPVRPTDNVNVVFSSWKNLLADRFERLYKNNLSQGERSLIEDFLASTKANISDPAMLQQLLDKIGGLSSALKQGAPTQAALRIIDQVDYIYRVLDCALSRSLIRYGYWDAEISLVRPDATKLVFAGCYDESKLF